MKYFSEKTNKTYDTEEECLTAEKELEERIAVEKAKKEQLTIERKARASEVEEAYKAVLEASKTYREKLNAFVKDYGSFHMTFRTGEGNPFDLFDKFFDRFW